MDSYGLGNRPNNPPPSEPCSSCNSVELVVCDGFHGVPAGGRKNKRDLALSVFCGDNVVLDEDEDGDGGIHASPVLLPAMSTRHILHDNFKKRSVRLGTMLAFAMVDWASLSQRTR